MGGGEGLKRTAKAYTDFLEKTHDRIGAKGGGTSCTEEEEK